MVKFDIQEGIRRKIISYSDIEKLVVRRPNPSLQINTRQGEFDRRYLNYNSDISRFYLEIEMLCSLLDIKPGEKVLNVGGGIGFTLYELANLGVECFNVDICPGDPQFVQGMADFYGLDIKAMRGDSCALPFGNNIFDSVYSKDTFEYIWDFETGMREQIRVLKPGGRHLVLVGNLFNPRTFYSMFVKRFTDSRGKAGGLKWLLTKHRAKIDFGIGWHGKDEDWKPLGWWKKKMKAFPELEPLTITTTRAYNYPDRLANRIFKPFVGGLIILSRKKPDSRNNFPLITSPLFRLT